MNCGILIFAHNNEHIDYIKMASISAAAAKKYLKVPVSLVTDNHSLEYLSKTSYEKTVIEIFDQIIVNDTGYYDNNHRILNIGHENKQLPFSNGDRSLAFDITPYDRTLVIDSDFIILSSVLENFWAYEQSFMMAKHSIDLGGNRLGPKDIRISETGIFLNYATTMMFTKNPEAETIFNLAKEIKIKYSQYANLYRFDPMVFRNDIVFSIANHMVSGFSTNNSAFLPDIKCFLTMDEVIKIDDLVKLKILIRQTNNPHGCYLCSMTGVDLHLMNKQTINDNFYKFLEVLK